MINVVINVVINAVILVDYSLSGFVIVADHSLSGSPALDWNNDQMMVYVPVHVPYLQLFVALAGKLKTPCHYLPLRDYENSTWQDKEK